MEKKKILLLCLALVMMMTVFAACSGGNNEPNNAASNNGNKTSNNTGSGDAEENLEPATFTFFNFQSRGQDVMASETTIGKMLQDQTGVDFKLEYLVGEADTKAGVMVASQDYPDVIAPEEKIDMLLDAGAFIALDELIEEHGPNIKRVYGPYFDKFRQEDGKIYHLPYSANQGYIGDPNINQGAFWMQSAVLQEFDYPKIKTVDEYFDLIRQYEAKYPEIDGKDTIGFAVFAPNDSFYTLTNMSMHLAGYPNDGGVLIDMDTLEARVYAATEDVEKPILQKLNELNAEGLFDPESFVMVKDQFMEKVTSGRLLGYFAYNWQIGEATNNLKTAGIDEKRYAPLPIVYDNDTKDQYVDPPGFVTNRGVGISTKAKDPVRIIQYFDNLLKEENQILTQWGIEGETFEVNEEGRFYMTPEQKANRDDNDFKVQFGFQYYEYGWPRYGNNSIYEDGNAYGPGNQPEVADMGFTDGDRKLFEVYDGTTFSDYFADPDDRPWFPAWAIQKEQGSKEQIYEQKSGDTQKLYLPKMILASPSDFDGIWNEYVEEFSKHDVQIYEDYVTENVRKLAEQ